MNTILNLIIFYTSSCFVLASSTYYILEKILPNGLVFGSIPRMFTYHWKHPYQYIAVVAVTYGILAVLWANYFGWLRGWKRYSSIIALIILTILLSSIPGGILWVIHDMQAGFLLSGTKFLRYLIWGANVGLTAGWLIILLSIPYNIIGILLGFIVTDVGQRKIGLR